MNVIISIHVPRVEDDASGEIHSSSFRRFQSTSPVWRTTGPNLMLVYKIVKFQSTSPVWRTT